MSTPAPDAESSDFRVIRPTLLLSATNFQRTADFICARRGEPETRWEQDVSAWLKAPLGTDGALDAIMDGQVEVWLYEDADHRLVGFASLGIALLSPMNLNGEPVTTYSVPYFGIHTDFRGKPDGPREQRYAWRIFQGLIDEAERRGEHPLLTLFVDPENPAYQGFYPLFGFVEVDRVTIGDRQWVRMGAPRSAVRRHHWRDFRSTAAPEPADSPSRPCYARTAGRAGYWVPGISGCGIRFFRSLDADNPPVFPLLPGILYSGALGDSESPGTSGRQGDCQSRSRRGAVGRALGLASHTSRLKGATSCGAVRVAK